MMHTFARLRILDWPAIFRVALLIESRYAHRLRKRWRVPIRYMSVLLTSIPV